MSCHVPCRADRQWLVFGNSKTWYNNNDQAGRAASASPPAPRMQSSCCCCCCCCYSCRLQTQRQCARQGKRGTGGRAAGWVGGETLQRRAAQLQAWRFAPAPALAGPAPWLPGPGPARAAGCYRRSQPRNLSCPCEVPPLVFRLGRVRAATCRSLQRIDILAASFAQSTPCCPPIDGLPWAKTSMSVSDLPPRLCARRVLTVTSKQRGMLFLAG